MIQRAEQWWNGAQNALWNGLSFDLVFVSNSRLKVSAQMPGYDWLAGERAAPIAVWSCFNLPVCLWSLLGATDT